MFEGLMHHIHLGFIRAVVGGLVVVDRLEEVHGLLGVPDGGGVRVDQAVAGIGGGVVIT